MFGGEFRELDVADVRQHIEFHTSGVSVEGAFLDPGWAYFFEPVGEPFRNRKIDGGEFPSVLLSLDGAKFRLDYGTGFSSDSFSLAFSVFHTSFNGCDPCPIFVLED